MEKDKIHLLESFARNSSSLASSFVNKVRFTFFLSLFSVLWLSFYFYQLFNFSFLAAGISFFISGLPVLIIFKLWILLLEVEELPERISVVKGSIRADDYELAELKQKGFLRKLFKLGKLIRSLLEIKDESIDIASKFSGALILGNPVFLTFFVIASVISWLIVFMGLITLLFFIF